MAELSTYYLIGSDFSGFYDHFIYEKLIVCFYIFWWKTKFLFLCNQTTGSFPSSSVLLDSSLWLPLLPALI